jgi:hypothetical protein
MTNILQGSDKPKFPGSFGNTPQVPVTLSAEMAALLGKPNLAPGEVPVTNVDLANNSYSTVTPPFSDKSGKNATTEFVKTVDTFALSSVNSRLTIHSQDCYVDSGGTAHIHAIVDVSAGAAVSMTTMLSGAPAPAVALWYFDLTPADWTAKSTEMSTAYINSAGGIQSIGNSAAGSFRVSGSYRVA